VGQIAQALEAIYFLVASIALIVGGGWAYFRFVAGRTLRRRLKVGVSGQIRRDQDSLRIIANCEAENIGLREFRITGEGTALRLLAQTLGAEGAIEAGEEARWELLGSWRAFDDRVLEPVETAENPLLVNLPNAEYAALRLELVVSVEARRSWRSAHVVFPAAGSDNYP
jgi:hypothetical protein